MNQEGTATAPGTKQPGARGRSHPPHHCFAGLSRQLGWQGALTAILALLFLLVWRAPPRHAFEGVASYAWLHLTLETPSILVAAMVFGVAWNAYRRERPGNIMILAVGLLAVAIIDFAHALSFKGMPDFVTASDPEKAINFWLAARFTFALVLAAAALRPWAPLSRPATRYLTLAGAVGFSALVLWAGLSYQTDLPRTFIAGQGLTAAKVTAEYVIIAVLVIPAFVFFRNARQRPSYDAQSLFAAAAISILSELCFTLYSDVTDIFNLLGHVYKLIAFGMIYRAVFVASVHEPFERMVQAEGRMRAASFYVRSLIEASIDPLFMIGPDGKITDINQAAEKATGVRRDMLIGTDFSAYFTAPDKARAGYQAVLADGLVRDYPLTLRDASGHCIDVLFNATAYRNDANRVEGILAAARDITEIRRAQQALERQNALLGKITETSPIGIMVWGLDGKITFANAEAEQLLARAADEIICLTRNGPHLMICDFGGRPLPDDELPFHKVKASGKSVYNVELAISGHAGKRTLLSVNASPLLGVGGELEGVVATLDDVTQRMASEEMLQASEARLKVAMAAARMGAWDWDVINDVMAYSVEFSQLMGLPKDISHPDFDTAMAAVHPGDRERVSTALRQAVVKEQGIWVDFRVTPPEGGIRWLSARATVTRDANGKALKISGLSMDITERKQSEIALERLNRALRTLSAANDRLIHAQDEAGLLNAVCHVIVEVGGYRMAWVGQAMQDDDKTVQCLAQCGDDSGFLDAARIVWSDTPQGQGPTGIAIRSGRTQINQNYHTSQQAGPWRELALMRGYQSSIAFPLRDGSGVHGVLAIYAGEPDAFDAGEVKLLQELADDLAFGIVTLRTRAERDRMEQEHQHYEARLRDSLVESIQAIATTLELRDPYTAGHQRRVAELARAIGQEMGLTEMQLEGLHLAASIHDVGKIRVPSEILTRPGRLSPIEMELIRAHAQAGYEILKDIRFPWPIARIVHEHHERIDGSGYPNGLSGDAILLESKIVTVADVVEAMTSHRPYRPGLGLDAALEHIAQYRGTWYDAGVVDTCLRLFGEGRYHFDTLSRKSEI